MTEQDDARVAREQEANNNARCLSMCKMLLRMTPDELKHAGHKTPEAGVVYTVRATLKDNEKVWAGFFRKHPD